MKVVRISRHSYYISSVCRHRTTSTPRIHLAGKKKNIAESSLASKIISYRLLQNVTCISIKTVENYSHVSLLPLRCTGALSTLVETSQRSQEIERMFPT